MRDRILSATPGLLAAGTAAFVLLTVVVASGLADPFDAAISGVIRHPGLNGPLGWLRPVTELGSTWVITGVAVLAALIGLALRRPHLGVAGALTIALGAFANSQMKLTIARSRPDLLEPLIREHGFSFPSGHAATSALAYGVLAVLVARSPLPGRVRMALGVLMAVLIVLVGVSRVYLGVHHPSDVLAGWLAGLLLVLLYAALTRAARMEPVGEAADADPAAPRSDPPARGSAPPPGS